MCIHTITVCRDRQRLNPIDNIVTLVSKFISSFTIFDVQILSRFKSSIKTLRGRQERNQSSPRLHVDHATQYPPSFYYHDDMTKV